MTNGFSGLNPEMHAALFKVTNRIHDLGMGVKTLSIEDYASILRQVCTALERSFANGLEDAIRYIAARANDPQMVQQANAVVNNLQAFQSFLRFEEDVLVKCGVRPDVAKALVRLTEQYRESFDLRALNAEAMLNNLRELQTTACNGMTDAAAYVANEQQLLKDAQFDLRVSATSITAANLSVLAMTMGGSGPFTTISTGFAGLMVMWAGTMKDRTQSPPKKKGWW